MDDSPSVFGPLAAGATAGLAVDIALFPIDTIKTRLQSSQGFWKAGGFTNIYSGLASTAIGSAPNAALFFCTYEMVKQLFIPMLPNHAHPAVFMGAACCGEVVACLIRVPVEVVKLRTQTNSQTSSWTTFRKTVASEGIFGLYRGYATTVMREIPFSFIQFPLWEAFKAAWSSYSQEKVNSAKAAACGAFAGGIAAAVTTPLDVAKTRVMLAEKSSHLAKGKLMPALAAIWEEKGIRGLFAGVAPRVLWISLGGAIFFGVYEKSRSLYARYIEKIS